MTDPGSHLSTALADRYRIERELGAGGMATVYLAQDLKHDRKVAIKVLRPELAAVIGAERFLREIKTIATLQHPHILGLIDSGEVDGTAYYVMPFVEGESLRDRLTREKQLPIGDAVRLATEVAAALDYAHRHGVIHRDIKPENILLHDGSALVADFGIALAVSSAGGGSRMTETGMSLGTPHYMSPEQAMGEREITARSDIYALGCVLYEMLTAEPPFEGATAQAIVARVLTESPSRAPAAAEERPAPRGGCGAHRAGEAAGGSLRERQGLRRGAGRSGLRRRVRVRDPRGFGVCRSRFGRPPTAVARAGGRHRPGRRRIGPRGGVGRVAPAPTRIPADRAALHDGPAGQPGVDRRSRDADGLRARWLGLRLFLAGRPDVALRRPARCRAGGRWTPGRRTRSSRRTDGGSASRWAPA